jgi:hypothetical protein
MVYVDGEPLAQTAFAKDALSPPPLAPLQQVFAAAKPGLRVKAAAPSDAFDAGTDIWIADSEIDAELEAMKKKKKTKQALAKELKTSRSQLDRLLDPDNQSV